MSYNKFQDELISFWIFLKINVDNPDLSDEDFRKIVRNSLPAEGLETMTKRNQGQNGQIYQSVTPDYL
jgi:hypothetical protein